MEKLHCSHSESDRIIPDGHSAAAGTRAYLSSAAEREVFATEVGDNSCGQGVSKHIDHGTKSVPGAPEEMGKP